MEYTNNYIKELVPPHDNYYCLEEVDGLWRYGLIMMENQNNPYMKQRKEFKTETEGAKYFFCDRLSAFYFSERIRPFMLKHGELDIGGPSFDENGLGKAMSMLGISSSLFHRDQRQDSKHRAIQLSSGDGTNYVVSFIDRKGSRVHFTIPINYQIAIFLTFKKVFMLYFLNKK
ncbi:hypothetical protein ERJ70_15260 [Sediminibacillus dalangtanensis]|uniref:Uncharacterized protein n=1 Tax=Sediminibacillus dalangtanensis TaxID=2729421 RepID=A0ABX7VVG5_9BACI|nr:hypothetical protein [Sediminibacillus dalangtanensis]QTN00534.1 hypothetical protein ERJ70_15260 [Sediminibacillus dalangtanensis]